MGWGGNSGCLPGAQATGVLRWRVVRKAIVKGCHGSATGEVREDVVGE